MSTRALKSLWLATVLAFFPLVAGAQEKAQLPYAMVSSYLELFKSLEHLDLIVPGMMILSLDPGVAPPTIEFKVRAADGWKTFSPDENGNIVFPDQPDWADLTLLSNQPKSTLQLIIGFSAVPLENTDITYKELMGLVPQFDEAMNSLAQMQGQPATKVTGLTIQLSEGSGAAVHVLSQKRKKTLKSNKAGVVVMRYSDATWQENPPVEFDEIPIGIVPLQ